MNPANPLLSSPLSSMTGFGRDEGLNDFYQVVVEIKSVNNRFKDFRFKAPSTVSFLEIDLRNKINERCRRGSFEVSINLKKAAQLDPTYDLDLEKIEKFIQNFKEKIDGEYQFSPTDFLRQEFLKNSSGTLEKSLQDLVCDVFGRALNKLCESREREGEALRKLMIAHRQQFEQEMAPLYELVDDYRLQVEEKIKKKCEEYAEIIKTDHSRMMQEVLYYLEKLDVNEELGRIKTHLERFDQILNEGREAGRELDFILQELNRETNTIGSKSGKSEISRIIVQMKVQLEKMREQALNLE